VRAHVWRYRGSLGSPQDRDQALGGSGGRSVGRADLSIREGLEGEGVALFPNRHFHSRQPSSQEGAGKPAALLRQRPRRKTGQLGLGFAAPPPLGRFGDVRIYATPVKTQYDMDGLRSKGRVAHGWNHIEQFS